MRREFKRRNKVIYLLVGVLFLMSIGYAAFSTSLNIGGTSNITNKWDVEIINVTNGTATGTAENAQTPIISQDKLTASMAANLYSKGDAMTYVVTVKNKGTLDAKLEDITKNIKTQNEAVKITFSGYTKGERLNVNETKDITVKIEYDENYQGTIDYNTPAEVEMTLNYTQAGGSSTNPSVDPLPDTYLITYNYQENGGTSSQAENARDKLVSIEMDSEYIQGATLEVWYAIQIINNSEIDYDYNVSEKYYYYGDPVGKQIKNHVVTVADYIDPEFVVEKEEVTIEGTDTKVNRNKDWEIVDANTLCADGYISTITKEQLLAEKYIVLKTEYFKDRELPTADELKDNPEKFPPVELYASKLLANQEDSLTFENHTEIVEINGKVARTIDSVETTNGKRIQNIKEYKPGDYVPNETREYDENKNKEIISSIEPIEKAGLHEQDDDMVKITITPPTGLGSNIMIYIITAAIALTITGIGIYFIKKKVL